MITAFWLLIKGINPRVYLGIALCIVVLYGFHEFKNRYIEQGKALIYQEWKIADAEREEKENDARIEEQQKQASINESIKKGHAHEIAKIRASITSAPKLRVGSAICGEFAKSPEATGTSGGVEADTGTRLVRDDIDRDIKSLELKVEEAFATCRAAQKFITANELAP
tara:strand:+ start:2047 stop:2550 length:504 start_codon:yes stop_codon:yes gene_type:complete